MSHGKNKKNFEVFCAEGFIAAITRQMRRAKREQKKLKNFGSSDSSVLLT
jgi:hypothetical protein